MNKKLKIHLKIAKKAFSGLKHIIFIAFMLWAEVKILDFLHHDLGLSFETVILTMLGILFLGAIIALWYNAYKYYEKYEE